MQTTTFPAGCRSAPLGPLLAAERPICRAVIRRCNSHPQFDCRNSQGEQHYCDQHQTCFDYRPRAIRTRFKCRANFHVPLQARNRTNATVLPYTLGKSVRCDPAHTRQRWTEGSRYGNAAKRKPRQFSTGLGSPPKVIPAREMRQVRRTPETLRKCNVATTVLM
jgi:hypothetical protein